MWAALRAQGLAALVGDLYAPLPAGAVAATLQGRRLGAARLRLLPKATGGMSKFLWLAVTAAWPRFISRVPAAEAVPGALRICKLLCGAPACFLSMTMPGRCHR